jgi:hypothetical protein
MMLLPAGLIFLWLLWRAHKQRKQTNIILGAVLGLFIIMSFVGWCLPPIAKVHSEYYQGKDQFEWASDLASPDARTRHEAMLALCEILKSSKSTVRLWIVPRLGDQGPEAKEAVPILIEFLKDDDPVLHEDIIFREEIREAIQKIDPSASAKIPKDE